MIKDYPDSHPSGSGLGSAYSGLMSPSASTSSSAMPSPASSVVSLPTSPISPTAPSFSSGGGLGNSLSARLAAAVTSPALPPPAAPRALPPPVRGPLLPPPQHPAASSNPAGLPTTTYTPYVPRAKRMQAARSEGNPLAADGRAVPVFSSSAQGGVTARHATTNQVPLPAPAPVARNGTHQSPREHQGPSAALLDKVRQLDALPRLGALQTLDLKGNEIRVSLGRYM
jgi:protein phosphatase 1 regulatory subunit 37